MTLLLMLISTSCSHDAVFDQKYSADNIHVNGDSTFNKEVNLRKMMFSVEDGNMAVERKECTRTTTDIDGSGTFSTGDLVAVAVTRNNTEKIKLYRVTSNGSLEYTGDEDDAFYWESSSETVSIRAWSYGTSTELSYTLTAPETRDYTLETDQENNDYLELLYCKATNISYTGNTISLSLYHQLSRIVFNVKHARTGDLDVTSYTVGNTSSFPVVASFAVPTGTSNVGTWTTKSSYSTITPKIETTQSGYKYTYSVVVIPTTYAHNSKLFTITNSEGDYVYTISETSGKTLTAGNQYNYAITVEDTKDITKNPLWYMAEYRLAQNGTSFDTDIGWGVTYLRTWTDAMNLGYSSQNSSSGTYNGYAVPSTPKYINGVSYHLPTQLEWYSVVPLYWGDDYNYLYKTTKSGDKTSGVSIPAATLRSEKCTFGYSNSTKYSNGTNNTNNTGITYYSYWSSVYGDVYFPNWTTETTVGKRYAIRFIGTEYCSVWRYVTTGTPGTDRRLEISSRLISPISSTNTSKLNQTITEIVSADESYWTDTTWGAVKRTIYWGGHTSNGSGTSYANNYNGHYVSTTGYYFNLACTGVTTGDTSLSGSATTFGMDIMLFRNK